MPVTRRSALSRTINEVSPVVIPAEVLLSFIKELAESNIATCQLQREQSSLFRVVHRIMDLLRTEMSDGMEGMEGRLGAMEMESEECGRIVTEVKDDVANLKRSLDATTLMAAQTSNEVRTLRVEFQEQRDQQQQQSHQPQNNRHDGIRNIRIINCSGRDGITRRDCPYCHTKALLHLTRHIKYACLFAPVEEQNLQVRMRKEKIPCDICSKLIQKQNMSLHKRTARCSQFRGPISSPAANTSGSDEAESSSRGMAGESFKKHY